MGFEGVSYCMCNKSMGWDNNGVAIQTMTPGTGSFDNLTGHTPREKKIPKQLGGGWSLAHDSNDNLYNGLHQRGSMHL